MGYWNLIQLIKASGGAGASGQSFKTNVEQAAEHVKMTDYLIQFPTFTGGQPQPPEELTYSSGHQFILDVSFGTFGDRVPAIRRNGTSPWTFLGSTAENGFTVTLTNVTWQDSTPKKATLTATVLGDYDVANTLQTLTGFSVYYEDFLFPNVPAGNQLAWVQVTPTVSGQGSPSGSDVKSLQWQFDPDTATFNLQSNNTTPSLPLRVARRALPSWSTRYEWEIHSNDSYTSTIGVNGYRFQSGTNTYFDNANPVGWIRYRLRAEHGGNGQWTNYGFVTWIDPRNDE